jgi:hypothetical protein
VLLDTGDELALADAFVVGVEGDRFNELEVVPIDVAFLYLFARLLLLSPGLLLFCLVVFEDQSASLKGFLRVAGEASEPIDFLIFKFENVGIRCHEPHEVSMMLGRGA